MLVEVFPTEYLKPSFLVLEIPHPPLTYSVVAKTMPLFRRLMAFTRGSMGQNFVPRG